jgi:hypothetical protein
MKSMKSLKTVAVLAAIVSSTAGAQVTGQKVAAPIGPLLELSAPGSCAVSCSLIGFGTITGGTIYSASVSGVAAKPVGTTGNFLAAGPTAGNPSLLTFSSGLSSIGFLWGSPDGYNTLEVLYSGGSFASFTAGGLGFAKTSGQQDFAQYVRFDAQTGYEITGLRFKSTSNAFEVSNFSVPAGTSQVPEPATMALFATGLVGLVGAARRRRQV